MVAQIQVVIRKILRGEARAALVVAASAESLARQRRGRRGARQTLGCPPHIGDGGGSRRGAGSGVLVAPAPAAPDDAGAFNQSRSRPSPRDERSSFSRASSTICRT